MRKVLTVILFGLAASTFVLGATTVPEIDPGAGASALTLLAGAMMLIRSKRKR